MKQQVQNGIRFVRRMWCENSAWNVLDPWELYWDIFGPFHVDTTKACETKSLGFFCFPPRNMWWHREDVYPKWFFPAKPTGLFSRCQIGCHGNLKELRDDGWFWVYGETAAFSLSQTNGHGSRLPKNVFDMKTKLYDIQRCKNFKGFHFLLSYCVDVFTVRVKRGRCNKMDV